MSRLPSPAGSRHQALGPCRSTLRYLCPEASAAVAWSDPNRTAYHRSPACAGVPFPHAPLTPSPPAMPRRARRPLAARLVPDDCRGRGAGAPRPGCRCAPTASSQPFPSVRAIHSTPGLAVKYSPSVRSAIAPTAGLSGEQFGAVEGSPGQPFVRARCKAVVSEHPVQDRGVSQGGRAGLPEPHDHLAPARTSSGNSLVTCPSLLRVSSGRPASIRSAELWLLALPGDWAQVPVPCRRRPSLEY